MVILSKACKQDNFQLPNSLNLSFMSMWGLCLDFVDSWILLVLYFPWIELPWYFCSMWDKLGWLNWFWQFLCERLSSFNPKGFQYSYAWSQTLYERRTSFCMRFISRKLCRYLCFQLALLHSESYFFFLYWSPSSSVQRFLFYFVKRRWGSLDQPIC